MGLSEACRYDGKRVVVVGGATGIGAAAATLAQMLTHIGICVSDLGRARSFYNRPTRLELIQAPGDPSLIPQVPLRQ